MGGHPEKKIIIHFVGKQNWANKSGVRGVSSVIIWGFVLRGLVLLQIRLAKFV